MQEIKLTNGKQTQKKQQTVVRIDTLAGFKSWWVEDISNIEILNNKCSDITLTLTDLNTTSYTKFIIDKLYKQKNFKLIIENIGEKSKINRRFILIVQKIVSISFINNQNKIQVKLKIKNYNFDF